MEKKYIIKIIGDTVFSEQYEVYCEDVIKASEIAKQLDTSKKGFSVVESAEMGGKLLIADEINTADEAPFKTDTEKFEEVVRPVLKYLCENHHPHMTVIVTGTSAEMMEGKKSIGQIMDYVLD